MSVKDVFPAKKANGILQNRTSMNVIRMYFDQMSVYVLKLSKIFACTWSAPKNMIEVRASAK